MKIEITSRSAALLSVLLLSIPVLARGAEPFTAEQLTVIERMLQAQREAIRGELLAELAAKPEEETQAPSTEQSRTRYPSAGHSMGMDITPSPASPDLVAVPLDRGMGNGISGLEMEVNDGKGEVRAVLAHTRAVPDAQRNVQNGWKVTASSALDDKDGGRGHFTTLDALRGGTAIELAFSHASTKRVVIDDHGVPARDWVSLCTAAGFADANGCTLAKIDAATRKPGAQHLAKAYQQFERTHYGWGYLYEAKLGAGKQDFEYLASDLSAQKEDFSTVSLGGSLGFANPRRNVLFAFGFDYQRSYEQADSHIYCGALTNPASPCVSGRLGKPQRENGRLLWTEVRSRFSRFPFSLRVTQNLASDETGVDLPIYFFRGEEGGFSGGLRVGWTSEDGTVGGVFIGSQFDVFR
ncbi:hypothetical protein ARC20_08610 [Stenotrophomonas panacihumi]|uniref:Uncharacterized protein n=1 Tax=Stenotrophomonas panacihumi TaxID=676599 RepID=A0A0R0AGY9_9GAMM|nr:hypothetical protein [Stenotrophomonas panacihumi]KRG44191.1 hypothetical protein ARC20_08610 [Stenotrophomonas panacihumi]PTN56250.1 hypothetical protein C9J98_00570 [Stenotrophomonas panacihumi]